MIDSNLFALPKKDELTFSQLELLQALVSYSNSVLGFFLLSQEIILDFFVWGLFFSFFLRNSYRPLRDPCICVFSDYFTI